MERHPPDGVQHVETDDALAWASAMSDTGETVRTGLGIRRHTGAAVFVADDLITGRDVDHRPPSGFLSARITTVQ